MPRNDSLLYSGVDTTATRRIRERAELVKSRKQLQKRELVPAGELLNAYIEQEIHNIADAILDYVDADKSDDNLKSAILAMKQYKAFLTTFKFKVNTILRQDVAKQGESFNE